jgi:hypothetical protein
MTEIEQATEALIAAINAARHRLPRGDDAYRDERDLLQLCEKARRLIDERRKAIERRGSARSDRKWRRRRLNQERRQQEDLRQQKQQHFDAGYRLGRIVAKV